MVSDKEVFESIYAKGAVWTEPTPPKELVELIESGKVVPCKALDVACGVGFYAKYLASRGFSVMGIDISENAIKQAKENIAPFAVELLAMDIADLDQMSEKFGFVFEWAILHHVLPEKRKKYVVTVKSLLEKGGKYLSVCFNDQNPDFGAKGERVRIVPEGAQMPTGTKLYYSSFDELKLLFESEFHIIEAKLITMTGGKKEHIGNYFFMEKT